MVASGLTSGKAVNACSGLWFLCMVSAAPGSLTGLLSDLNVAQADFYHPVHTVLKVCTNGNKGPNNKFKRRVEQSLFPGYLFLNGQTARDVAYDGRHAYRVDPVANGMQGPLTEQLKAVEYKIELDDSFSTGPQFCAGVAVRVLHPHPLAGTLGRVSTDSPEGDPTVWVNIPLLNAGIPLEIPLAEIEEVVDTKTQLRTLLVCCSDCGRDTRNVSGLCDRCK